MQWAMPFFHFLTLTPTHFRVIYISHSQAAYVHLLTLPRWSVTGYCWLSGSVAIFSGSLKITWGLLVAIGLKGSKLPNVSSLLCYSTGVAETRFKPKVYGLVSYRKKCRLWRMDSSLCINLERNLTILSRAMKQIILDKVIPHTPNYYTCVPFFIQRVPPASSSSAGAQRVLSPKSKNWRS